MPLSFQFSFPFLSRVGRPADLEVAAVANRIRMPGRGAAGRYHRRDRPAGGEARLGKPAPGLAPLGKPALAPPDKPGLAPPGKAGAASGCKLGPTGQCANRADSCRAGGIRQMAPDGRPNRSLQRPE